MVRSATLLAEYILPLLLLLIAVWYHWEQSILDWSPLGNASDATSPDGVDVVEVDYGQNHSTHHKTNRKSWEAPMVFVELKGL